MFTLSFHYLFASSHYPHPYTQDSRNRFSAKIIGTCLLPGRAEVKRSRGFAFKQLSLSTHVFPHARAAPLRFSTPPRRTACRMPPPSSALEASSGPMRLGKVAGCNIVVRPRSVLRSARPSARPISRRLLSGARQPRSRWRRITFSRVTVYDPGGYDIQRRVRGSYGQRIHHSITLLGATARVSSYLAQPSNIAALQDLASMKDHVKVYDCRRKRPPSWPSRRAGWLVRLLWAWRSKRLLVSSRDVCPADENEHHVAVPARAHPIERNAGLGDLEDGRGRAIVALLE